MKDPTIATILELIPGFFFQVFGLGHIYSGNILKGILTMVAYWIIQVFNIVLCIALVGFITLPLTWVLFMVFSSLNAAKSCK